MESYCCYCSLLDDVGAVTAIALFLFQIVWCTHQSCDLVKLLSWYSIPFSGGTVHWIVHWTSIQSDELKKKKRYPKNMVFRFVSTFFFYNFFELIGNWKWFEKKLKLKIICNYTNFRDELKSNRQLVSCPTRLLKKKMAFLNDLHKNIMRRIVYTVIVLSPVGRNVK